MEQPTIQSVPFLLPLVLMEQPTIQPVHYRSLHVPVQQLSLVLSQMVQELNLEPVIQVLGYYLEVVQSHHVIPDIKYTTMLV